MSSYIYTTTTDNNFTFAELEANIVHLPDDNTGNYVLVKTVDDEYSWKNVQEFSGDISNIPSQVSFNITGGTEGTGNTLTTIDAAYTFIVNFYIDDIISYANTDKQLIEVYIGEQFIDSFNLDNTTQKQQRIFNSAEKGKLQINNLLTQVDSIFTI